MFTVARNGAGVADPGRGVRLVRFGRRRVAGDAGEEALAKGSKSLRARVECLWLSARCDMRWLESVW
jgi:hypothetical protein